MARVFSKVDVTKIKSMNLEKWASLNRNNLCKSFVSQNGFNNLMYNAGIRTHNRKTDAPIQFMKHQKEFIEFLFCNTKKAAVLAHEMGLGKTATILGSIAMIDFAPQTCIVVCPPSTLLSVWVPHVKQWTSWNVLVVQSKKDLQQLQSVDEYRVVLITYTVLVNHYKTGFEKKVVSEDNGSGRRHNRTIWIQKTNKKPLLYRQSYGLVAFDEAHRMRDASPKSPTHAACRALSEHGVYRIASTGTPLANSPTDIPGILDGLAVNDEIAHRETWIQGGDTRTINMLASDRYKTIYQHRRTSSELLAQLPQIRHYKIETKDVRFTQSAKDVYNDLLFEAQALQILINKNANDQRDRMRLIQIMFQMLVLLVHPSLLETSLREVRRTTRQIVDEEGGGEDANGEQPEPEDDDLDEDLAEAEVRHAVNIDKEAIHDGQGKLPIIKKILDEIILPKHDKCVVVSHSINVLLACQAVYTEPSLMYTGVLKLDQRQKIIEAFLSKDDPHRVLFLSLKAGGEGIHLVSEYGPTAMIFVTNWYSPSAHLQAEKRIHRIGQTRPVDIYTVMVPNTLDTAIFALQENKMTLTSAVVDGDRNTLNTSTGATTVTWREAGRIVSKSKPM